MDYTKYKYETYKRVWFILEGETSHFNSYHGYINHHYSLLTEEEFNQTIQELQEAEDFEPEDPDEAYSNAITYVGLLSKLFLREKLNPFYLGEQ